MLQRQFKAISLYQCECENRQAAVFEKRQEDSVAKERKRRGRRGYLEDFQKTASGEYIYKGVCHAYQEDGLSRKKALAVLWLLTVGMAASVVIGGCMPAAGLMDCWYVILPWGLCLVAIVSVVWLMGRLTAGGDPLRDYVYRATILQSGLRGNLTLILAAATIAGEAVYLFGSGFGGRVKETAVFLFCMLALLVCALLWRLIMRRLHWSSGK